MHLITMCISEAVEPDLGSVQSGIGSEARVELEITLIDVGMVR